MNPYRTDPHSDPFEIFLLKHQGTPQCLAVATSEDPKLLYTRGFEVKQIADVEPGKVALVIDEVTHQYMHFDRELFMREDQKFDPFTGELVT